MDAHIAAITVNDENPITKYTTVTVIPIIHHLGMALRLFSRVIHDPRIMSRGKTSPHPISVSMLGMNGEKTETVFMTA